MDELKNALLKRGLNLSGKIVIFPAFIAGVDGTMGIYIPDDVGVDEPGVITIEYGEEGVGGMIADAIFDVGFNAQNMIVQIS